MVREIQEVKLSAMRFREYASKYLPVKKVLLYGSYAKGNPRPDSDIDIAVFLDLPEHKNRLELATKLFRYAGDVDVDIEPKCFFWDEYLHYEQGSILSEIIKTAIDIN